MCFEVKIFEDKLLKRYKIIQSKQVIPCNWMTASLANYLITKMSWQKLETNYFQLPPTFEKG